MAWQGYLTCSQDHTGASDRAKLKPKALSCQRLPFNSSIQALTH